MGDFFRARSYRTQAREEFLNVHAFDAVLVNSLFSRETMLRTYGLDAKVCYLGVDTGLFVDRKKPREDFVVGIGTIYDGKNIRLLLESLANSRKPAPRLVWIGNTVDATYLDELRLLAESLGVEFEARVRIKDSELVDLLNRALAMVYAPRLEPFGFAPLEASACGLPVVAVAEGGVRETVVDGVNGILVEHNPTAMAQAIDCLRGNPDYARKLGEGGRRLVTEKWNWDAAIDRLEDRFAETIAFAHSARGRRSG
jgi:glycosyltransferase involved in cell wall biosynthesis